MTRTQVSTTTPPKKSLGSSSDDPSKMAELDKAAVESMLEENGLNEVTLKVCPFFCARIFETAFRVRPLNLRSDAIRDLTCRA